MQPNLSIYYWSYPVIMLGATFWMAWMLRCKVAVALSGVSRNGGKLDEAYQRTVSDWSADG